MLSSLLPSCTSTVEASPDMWEAELHPEEAAVVSRAVEKRRREFRAGRHCARAALDQLGVPSAAPLLPGLQRDPQWPPGIVGSITHCNGYCACAVARSTELMGLGIDAERNAPLPDGVTERIASPSELAAVGQHPRMPGPAILFSAKESVFKAWFPLTRRWLEFDDVEIELDPEHGQFSVRTVVDTGIDQEGILTRVMGRFDWSEDRVYTVAWIPG